MHSSANEQLDKARTALMARVAVLISELEEIEKSIAIGINLLETAEKGPPEYRLEFAHNQRWKREILAQHENCQRFKADLQSLTRDTVTATIIHYLEASIERLRINQQTHCERVMALGKWRQKREDNEGALKKGWNFEEATGNGPGLDEVEEVDPKDSTKPNPNEDAGMYSNAYSQLTKGTRWDSC